jgi:hypothetical protein
VIACYGCGEEISSLAADALPPPPQPSSDGMRVLPGPVQTGVAVTSQGGHGMKTAKKVKTITKIVVREHLTTTV